MTKSISIAAVLTFLPLAVLSSPMPTTPAKRFTLEKRLEDGVDCVSSTVDVPIDMIYCVASDGTALYCDDCNNASSGDGTSCYISTGDDGSIGTQIACPLDSVPEHNPDGTPVGEEAAQAGLLSYCKTPLGGGQVAFWTKLGTCLGYSLLSAGGDPAAANKAGITGLCDVFFVSSCSMFAALNGELLDPVDCIPEPDNETLCSFANLG